MTREAKATPPARQIDSANINAVIQRAQSDLQLCQNELGKYHLKQERCEELVTLLTGAIQVAQRDQEVSRLQKTYYNIHKMVGGWAFEFTFKTIFRRAVHDLEAGIIPGLLTENKRLEEALSTSEEAREILQQESDEKDLIIADLRKQLDERNNPGGSRRASNDSGYGPLPAAHFTQDTLPPTRAPGSLPPKVGARPAAPRYQKM